MDFSEKLTTCRRLFAVATLAFLAVVPTASPASASPTMFVEPQQGLAWWLRLKLVPSGRADGGLTVEQINTFIKARLNQRAVSSPAQSFIPICHMSFARSNDVVSSDRETQAEIAETFREFPRAFSESLVVGNENFLLRVGIFEDCPAAGGDDAPTPFMALVITDATGALREFDALTWNFIRLFKRSDGKINVFGCFSCGEVQEVAYNPIEREFYYKWIGH